MWNVFAVVREWCSVVGNRQIQILYLVFFFWGGRARRLLVGRGGRGGVTASKRLLHNRPNDEAAQSAPASAAPHGCAIQYCPNRFCVRACVFVRVWTALGLSFTHCSGPEAMQDGAFRPYMPMVVLCACALWPRTVLPCTGGTYSGPNRSWWLA